MNKFKVGDHVLIKNHGLYGLKDNRAIVTELIGDKFYNIKLKNYNSEWYNSEWNVLSQHIELDPFYYDLQDILKE